jgi:UDP-glucose 4-epimerase
VARRALEGLWSSGIGNFPAAELDYIRYLCMVDDTRARNELGYQHQHDLQSTLAAAFDDC